MMIKLYDDFAAIDDEGARQVLGYGTTDEMGLTMILFSVLYPASLLLLPHDGQTETEKSHV